MKDKSIIHSVQNYLKKNKTTFILLVLSMHIAGMLGLWFEATRYWFELLTPFNLLTSISLVILFHKDYSASFWKFVVITFFVGFGSEVIGVHTGLIFGNYAYGATLGLKLWQVPLLIGANWVMLVYVINYVWHSTSSFPLYLKAVLSAISMMALDYFIEPVAIQHDFWSWENGSIPLQNYIGWFLVALPLCLLYHYSTFSKKNDFAVALLIAQTLFFVGYRILAFIFN